MNPDTKSALIEIVQSRPATKGLGGDLIVPDEVRLNGQPLLMMEGDPIIVHEVVADSRDIVKVTMTLPVRRVLIGTAEDIEATA